MVGKPVEPLLNLNDPELEWKRFERYCLDLTKLLPDVRDAHLYGVQGDDQEGIDIHADLHDGRVRTIQCRRVAKFGKPQAEKTIKDTTYDGDEHWIWTTCSMTAPARKAIQAAPKFTGWDIEQLSSKVRELPREAARWLVEDHLGEAERRRVLGPDAALTIAPAIAWFARADGDSRFLPTNQPLQDRIEELARLRDCLEADDVLCVLLVGRGGIGKTRLLRALAESVSKRRIFALRDGVEVSATLGAELPLASFDMLIDDAHQRQELPGILATLLDQSSLQTIVLATRPQGVDSLRASLSARGLSPSAIRVLDPLRALESDAAERLAKISLDEAHQPLAAPLADATNDSPALLVIAGQVISSGGVGAEALIASPTMRREILAQYSEEQLGRVDPGVDPGTAARVLSLVAAVQPVDPQAPLIPGWIGQQTGDDEAAVTDALAALKRADLLRGPKLRQRVAPDVLADFLVYRQCVDDAGQPNGRAEELVDTAPLELLGQLMVNLAALDWRLGRAGEPRLLDAACARVSERAKSSDAWQRERLLEPLIASAPYLAPWVIRLTRELLDNPARDEELFGDHVVTDADARRPLVQLLAGAGLDPEQTAAAIRLLWEIGADVDEQQSRAGGDPIGEVKRLADYRRPLHYGEALLGVVENLSADPAEAEAHRHLPIEMVGGLATREGTTTESAGRAAIRLGSYVVNAEATSDVRSRLRALLVRLCLEGGERTRPAAAALLGDMMRQPSGYFGRPVPGKALTQWIPEQLAILEDMRAIFGASTDALVAREIRHAVEWHAKFSALRGVKTTVRRLQRDFPPSHEEELADALSQSLARFGDVRASRRAMRRVAKDLREREGSVGAVLDAVDAALKRLRRARPGEYADVGPLLFALSADTTWALEACELLISEPRRPTAAGVGMLLSETLGNDPEAVRTLLASLAASPDPNLRLLAADHVSRVRWFGDPNAVEPALAVSLAADDEPAVVRAMLLTAHRVSDHDADLAKRIVLSVPDLSHARVAEDACMVLSNDLPMSAEEWQAVFDRLLLCPEVEYWYEDALSERAKAEPRQVLDHFIERIRHSPDDYRYRALPFDGFKSDLLAADPHARAAVLAEVADLLSMHPSGRAAMDWPTLFWSLDAGTGQALDVLAKCLASVASHWSAAEALINDAPRMTFLNAPEWVRGQLDAARSGDTLRRLEGALYASLSSGLKQGVPGSPFPEDVQLERQAREHEAAMPPGSRAAAFWTKIAESAAREMQREIELDEEDE
jgi:hypothetical protein